MSESVELDDCRMIPCVAQQWLTMPPEDKAVLRFAFKQAMTNPKLVADYAVVRQIVGSFALKIHCIRIGYARFAIATSLQIPSIIIELSVDRVNFSAFV